MNRNATRHAERRAAQYPISAAYLDAKLVKNVEETALDILIYPTRPAHLAKSKTETASEKEWLDSRWQSAHQSLDKSMTLPLGWRILSGAAGGVLYLSVLALAIAPIVILALQSGWPTLLYPLFSLLLAVVGVEWSERQQARWRKTRPFAPETLVQILPLIKHKSARRSAYAAAVAALIPHAPIWGRAVMQSHLTDLTTLFAQGKETAARRMEIEQIMGRQTVSDLNAEAGNIAERLRQTSDKEARAAYMQGLAHLEGRRARLQSLTLLRERLEAQETAIVQAFKEAQITLATAQFTGANQALPSTENGASRPKETALPAPWSDTMRRLHRQTTATEQALQEVLGVSRGG